MSTGLGEYSGENYDASTSTIAELQRQLLEAKEQREWQPIETAPKDGTLILVFYPELHGYNRYSLRYWSTGDWGQVSEAWSDQWRQIQPNHTPSFWAPLTPPTLSRPTPGSKEKP